MSVYECVTHLQLERMRVCVDVDVDMVVRVCAIHLKSVRVFVRERVWMCV